MTQTWPKRVYDTVRRGRKLTGGMVLKKEGACRKRKERRNRIAGRPVVTV